MEADLNVVIDLISCAMHVPHTESAPCTMDEQCQSRKMTLIQWIIQWRTLRTFDKEYKTKCASKT